ncbi:MAG: hypothetical protein KDD37_06380, partial [Bdellovibrionales bacterium]|nr:hypothetical protein [Bdellovibrionales bacterium]
LYWKHSEAGEKSSIAQNILSLFNLIPLESSSFISILKSTEIVLKNNSSLLFCAEKILDIISDKQSVLVKSLNTLNYVSEVASRDILARQLVFSKNAVAENLSYLFVTSHLAARDAVSDIYDQMTLIAHDEAIDFGRMRDSLQEITDLEMNTPRIFPHLSSILKDESSADIIANTVYVMAATGQSKGLVDEYLHFMIKGDFSSVLEYMDAFKPSHSRASNF